MNRYKYLAAGLLTIMLSSCIGDLDQKPLNKQIVTSENVFDKPESYKEFLAKLYGSLTLTGQRGEYGKPEIPAPDEGTTSFLRTFWSMQELTTDEAITAWGDAGLMEFNGHSWSAKNGYVQLLYQRIFINIAYCNEFIREVEPRIGGLSADIQPDVTEYVAEARFLRALYYYYAMDLWGNVPFVTEADVTGAFLPKQIQRADLFAYIESELKTIIPVLVPAGENEYARADQAAAKMLLAKMYLNAEVYLGSGNKRYTECIAYCNEIIGAGKYSLNNSYSELFLADNDRLNNEIIFPVAEDGDNTRNYGGVTFIVHGGVGGSEDPDNGFGIAAGGWWGHRMTDDFVTSKFSDPSGNTDSRALFYTDGQTLDINNVTVFTEGYLSAKFKNITSSGAKGKNGIFVDTDFPLFRLADVYLMYAEAVLRGGSGGDLSTALNYVNEIRNRAYGDDTGNIDNSQLTLDFILDERAREFYWEAQRRTDLIRFDKLTGDDYLWEWKGGAKNGVATQTQFNLFPIPASDIAVNPNLKQNTGY